MLFMRVSAVNSVRVGEGETPLTAYERVRATADPSVCCDYSLRVDLSTWSDPISKDMETLTNSKGAIIFIGFRNLRQAPWIEFFLWSNVKEIFCIYFVFTCDGIFWRNFSVICFDVYFVEYL